MGDQPTRVPPSNWERRSLGTDDGEEDYNPQTATVAPTLDQSTRIELLLLRSQQEAKEERRASEIRTVMKTFRKEHGLFQRRNVTQFVRDFELEFRDLDMTEAELRKAFLKVVDPDYEDPVRDCFDSSSTWRTMKDKLRVEFKSEDATRMTRETFQR